MDLEEAGHHPSGPGLTNGSEVAVLKKTVEQQRKSLEDLKLQLESKEKALLDLDKQIKQVRFGHPVAIRIRIRIFQKLHLHHYQTIFFCVDPINTES